MRLPRDLVIAGVSVDISSFDFSDHSSRRSYVRTASLVLIVLVSFFVSLRLLVRGFLVRKIFVDDVWILIASAMTIALASVCIAATGSGLGTHVWLLPLGSIFNIIKQCIQYLFICQILYACAIASTKISIIASYLRFIQDRKFRFALYATGFITCGLWVTGVLVTVFQCKPISAAWDFTIQPRQCMVYRNYIYASSSINIATDIVLCVLPCPYLWRLNIPTRQRVILCLLFLGGVGACIGAIIRIAFLHQLTGNLDVTYTSVHPLLLSAIECALGIICVSIPALRPLAAKIWPTVMASRFHGSSRSKTATSAKSALQSRSGRFTKLESNPTSATNMNDPHSQTELNVAVEALESGIELKPVVQHHDTRIDKSHP